MGNAPAGESAGDTKRDEHAPLPSGISIRSPEQLDSVVEATTMRSWIAIGAAVFAVVVLAVWAFAGSIPERVSVPGMMTRPGAVVEVFAEAAGTVSAVSVVTGQTVATGDTLVTMTGEDGSQLDIVSTIDGVVQGVSARPGLIVAAGTSMATIVDEASDAPLRALAYLNPADVQSLGVTDRVTVAPAAVNGTEYGSLVGHVTFVADVPASIPEMGEELGSTALAQEFSQATGGISYLVIVEFDDPPTWEGGDPFPEPIVAGTIAEISAIVERQRPIDRVF